MALGGVRTSGISIGISDSLGIGSSGLDCNVVGISSNSLGLFSDRIGDVKFRLGSKSFSGDGAIVRGDSIGSGSKSVSTDGTAVGKEYRFVSRSNSVGIAGTRTSKCISAADSKSGLLRTGGNRTAALRRGPGTTGVLILVGSSNSGSIGWEF